MAYLMHPQFDPVAINIGPLSVHWYGLMYLLAFVLFVLLGRVHAKQLPQAGWTNQAIDDLLFYGALGVVLGGRLGYTCASGMDMDEAAKIDAEASRLEKLAKE